MINERKQSFFCFHKIKINPKFEFWNVIYEKHHHRREHFGGRERRVLSFSSRELHTFFHHNGFYWIIKKLLYWCSTFVDCWYMRTFQVLLRIIIPILLLIINWSLKQKILENEEKIDQNELRLIYVVELEVMNLCTFAKRN